MGVEKILEPFAPAGIRSNVGQQRLNDQRDHVKAVVAYAACLPRHGQFRFDGEFPIPQPAVMRADVANSRQGVEPAYKDRLRLIECRRKIGTVSIAEDAQVFSNLVGNDGSDADFNHVQCFAHEPPQVGIESVEVNDLLEGRYRTKVAGGGVFEGNEIRAQTVIANSSQPIQRTGPVRTGKAATDQ